LAKVCVKVFLGPARVFDRMGSSDDTTLWGSSSLFVQVTVVPADRCGR